jgi:predicted nuclease of predicted toxin-antitoxin system
VRLLLDANLSSRRIGHALRRRGHDVRGIADELELEGLEAEALLALATADERILITRNSRDFAPICRSWAGTGRDHAGVILIWTLSHRQYGEIIRAVERRLEDLPDARAWRGVVIGI